MEVIDKILSEWSFRCHDGVVDINDPNKVSILKEILIEEGIEDDILDATLNLPKDDPASEEKKRKALAILTGTSGDEKDKEIERLTKLLDGPKQEKEKKAKALIAIEDELETRNLKFSTAAQIIRTFARADEEEKLINYFGENGKNLPRLEVKDGVNIKTIPQERLNKDIINKIYPELDGASKTKGIGKEENFLVAFYKNVTKEEKGDVKIDDEKYEIKGVGAMVTPSDIGRSSKKDVVTFLKPNFINNLNIDDTQKIEIEDIFKKKERWTYTISNLYKTYPDKSDFFKNIKEALNKKYPGLNIDEQILEDGKTLATTITKYLIKQSGIKEKILFISPEGIMKVYDLNTLLEAIDKEINITAFSDFAPRLTFKDPENDISKQNDEPIKVKEKEKIKIEIANLKDNVKTYNGVKYVSQKWFNEHEKEQKYFDNNKSIQNFVPLKAEYKDIIELIPYASSLSEELTDYLVKSFK